MVKGADYSKLSAGGPLRGMMSALISVALAGALPSAAALAQHEEAEAAGDVSFELDLPPGARAEVYIGREPQTLLICLVAGSRATIDISSERTSRSVLEREECVLVMEREVFATAGADEPATVLVRLVR